MKATLDQVLDHFKSHGLIGYSEDNGSEVTLYFDEDLTYDCRERKFEFFNWTVTCVFLTTLKQQHLRQP